LSHATGFIIWLATTIWKSFLKDKDATETSVQNLNDSFSEFRGQTIEALHAIRSDIKVLSKLPSESEIMKRLEEKQELLIYKAVREMRSRD
jgi:predicted transcriptional regulator YheO